MIENLHKISVIVPAYNAAEYLETTLRSICNQTYTNLEIIVVDDGSTDETKKVAERIQYHDKRIILISSPMNQGQIPSRNKGISLATGDFIGFIDSDDTIVPDFYERLLSNALKYNADISHSGISFCYPNGIVEQHHGTGELFIQDTYKGLIDLLKGKIIEPSLCNKLYKASLFKNYSFNSSIQNNEDLLLNFYLFQQSKKSVFEDFCGYKYNQREGSFSKNKERKLAATKDILKARKNIVNKSDEVIRPHALRLLIGTYIGILKEEYCHPNTYPEAFISEIKEEFTKHKHHFRFLSFTQRVAVLIISYTPSAFNFIYTIYSKLMRY